MRFTNSIRTVQHSNSKQTPANVKSLSTFDNSAWAQVIDSIVYSRHFRHQRAGHLAEYLCHVVGHAYLCSCFRGAMYQMNVIAPVSLDEMLARVASGDRLAFRAVYSQAGPKLYAICLRMMKVKDQAEDVFQEAFVKIWERSWQFDPARGEAMAWLATVTRHCALDRLRKFKGSHVTFDETVVEEIDAHTAALAAGAGEAGDLRKCMGQLREDFRNSVMLVYMKGLTYEELAGQLGKPVSTTKTWVRRGLIQLRECMNG